MLIEGCDQYMPIRRCQCRSAKAPTKMEAIKTATDNACAYLASGMNESMSCGRTTPKSTKCE
jgi:hypothetical protein